MPHNDPAPADVVFLIDVDNTLLDNDRVTTIFPRQGHYAHDPKILAAYPPADITVDRIGDLTNLDLTAIHSTAAWRPGTP